MDHETFWSLVQDPAHWELEALIVFIVDGVIGLVIWPFLKSFKKHHKSDDAQVEELQARVELLEGVIAATFGPEIVEKVRKAMPVKKLPACGVEFGIAELPCPREKGHDGRHSHIMAVK